MSCRAQPYEKETIDLSVARDGTDAFKKSGSGLFIRSISSDGTLTVKFNESSGDEIPLDERGGIRYIEFPFKQLFFKNSAQAGKSAEIWILRKGTRFIGLRVATQFLTELGVLHGSDSTEYTETNVAYQLKATILFHALGIKTVNEIHLQILRELGTSPYGFKLTKEIDDSGSETTIVEITSGVPSSYTWYVIDSDDFDAIEGDIIAIHLYLKGDGGATEVKVTDFQVYGDYEKEKIEYA